MVIVGFASIADTEDTATKPGKHMAWPHISLLPAHTIIACAVNCWSYSGFASSCVENNSCFCMDNSFQSVRHEKFMLVIFTLTIKGRISVPLLAVPYSGPRDRSTSDNCQMF